MASTLIDSMSAVTLSDIQRARQRVASCVRRTPLVVSSALSERLGTTLYVKLELFQKSGSFKVRGVFNKILSLPPAIREKGITTVSGGNHALAVEIARIPESIRGYGHVKEGFLAGAKAKEAQLLAQFRNPLHIELAA